MKDNVLFLAGFVVGFAVMFVIVMTDRSYRESDEVINAMLLCQSQVPENVTCKITAIPYEATVRLGQ
jgi:hypothetical protein